MRALIMTTAFAFCLLGCATPAQQAQKQQAEMERMMAEYGPACSQLGYAVNTDLWRNCVMQLAAKNDSQRGRVSTSIFGSWGGWGRGAGVGVGLGR
jgi:hypothetical protein